MTFIKIAFRNLNRQKKRTLLLGGAIAFGIMIITLLNGLTAGATKNIKENFSYLLAGEVYLSEEIKREDGTVVEEFSDDEIIIEALQGVGITEEDIVRRSALFGTLLFNGRENIQSIIGVDWQAEDALRNRLSLIEGDIEAVANDERAIIISESVRDRLRIELGEEIDIRGETVTGQLNVGTFVVRGIMSDPGFLGNIASYANIDRVNRMINLKEGSYQTLNIALDEGVSVDLFTDLLYERLSEQVQMKDREGELDLDFSFSLAFEQEAEEEWEGARFELTNINENPLITLFDQAAVVINIIGFIVLLLVIGITIVGVFNTFRMIMYERIKEIGTMRAVGIQQPGVRSIFLWEAFALSIVGYLMGLVLAIVASFLIGLYKVPLDNAFSLFTFNGSLTFPLTLGSLIFNFIFIALLTVLGALYPATKAAKLQPADALRMES
jgi:putative ABC transport system permease protein